jgi:hypothetical protein
VTFIPAVEQIVNGSKTYWVKAEFKESQDHYRGSYFTTYYPTGWFDGRLDVSSFEEQTLVR